MIPRRPDIGLDEDLPLVWTRVPEFSLIFDGISAVIPAVEFFLNNVMAEVRQKYAAADPQLAADIDVFTRQEAYHSRYHLQLNRMVYDRGLGELRDFAGAFGARLQTMRKERSLAFNVAYCAGFENAATFSSIYLFEKCDELLAGADPRCANLYLWHVAEEFEHRSVCFDVFRAVSGNYFLRVWVLIYSWWQLNKAFNEAAAIVLAKYRESMSAEERSASIRREKRLARRQALFTLPRTLLLLIPNFSPARLRPSRKVLAALEYFKSSAPIRENFGDVYARGEIRAA